MIYTFLKRQFHLVKKNGLSEIIRKIKLFPKYILDYFFFLFFTPIFFLLFLIAKIFKYKIVTNQVICWRLGHFLGNTDFFISNKKNIPNNDKIIFLWYLPCEPCNYFFYKKLKNKINIVPSFIGQSLEAISNIFYKKNINTDRDIFNYLDSSPPNFQFTNSELEEGFRFLSSLGISKTDKFVCLNVRDEAYLRQQLPWWDWSYHNYRNCNIENYSDAAIELANKGFYVFRMGAIVNKPFDLKHPKIFDYASNGMRTEFLDIFLGAHCAFAISNGTGFDAVPYIFRRPILYVDHVPLGIINSFSKRFLITTKKVWSEDYKRYLTFEEIFSSGIGYDLSGNLSKYHGNLSFHESNSKEIKSYVDEMILRNEKKWVDTKKDKYNQKIFWSIYEKREGIHGKIKSIISTNFLRKNVKLLKKRNIQIRKIL